MSIYDQIIAAYPELEDGEAFSNLTIMLQDDCDGQGVFIAKWDYEKPLPEGLTVGKP